MDMDDPLGFPGCPGCVEDIQRGFGIQLFCFTNRSLTFNPFLPVNFLWGGKGWTLDLTAYDYYMVDRRAGFDGLVHDWFQWDNLASVEPDISGDY
jgi:hypothetical protein